MKKIRSLLTISSFLGLAFFANAARQVGVDFAPLNRWNVSTEKLEALQANGLGLGWYIKGGATVDGKAIDYTKLQTDEEYARKLRDQNDDAFQDSVYNVLYNVKTGKSLSDVPKPKDIDGNEVTYAACFEGAAFGSNHRDCDLDYEPTTNIALVHVNLRWESGSIEAIKVVEGRATAWGNLTDDVKALFSKALDKQYSNDEAYKTNKENLAFNFYVKGMDKNPDAANEVIVTGSGDASVPKSDAFDAVIKGALILYSKDDLVKVKKLPSVHK